MRNIILTLFVFTSSFLFLNTTTNIPIFNLSQASSLDQLLDKINNDDPRRIIERKETIYTEILDQSAHLVVSLLILSIFLFGSKHRPLLSGLISGFFIGCIREVTEEGTLVTLEVVADVFKDVDAYIDLTFWALGGLLAGVVSKYRK